METTEIRSRVIDIMTGIMPTWNKIEIKDTDNLREDIGMESIDFLDIIMQKQNDYITYRNQRKRQNQRQWLTSFHL